MVLKRDNALDILKGIGIITMIMGHSNMGENFILYVAGFHMQLFFIVSGYLFNQFKYSFKEFTKRKIKTLIIPYLTFAITTLVYCVIISLVNKSNIYDFPNCLIGIAFSNRSIFPITGALWFLQCLFCVNILFFLSGKFGEIIRAIIISIFFLGAWCQSRYDVWLPFALDSALSAIVLFYIGYLLKNVTFKPTNTKTILFIAIITLSITYFTIKFNGDVNPRTCSYGLYYLLYYINSLLATLGWYFLIIYIGMYKSMYKKIGCYISKIGKDSIVFVGLNQLIIVTLYQICRYFYSFPNSSERAIRNILICGLTLFILKFLSDWIGKSRYKILIGK